MAEIHVERKRGVGPWLWVILVVLLIVAAAVYLWQAGYINLSDADAPMRQLAAIAGGRHGA